MKIPVVPILILLFSFLIAYPVYMLGIDMLDEGAILHIAERLTQGDVLYRDVATGIMPGIYYLEALIFTLFGYTVKAGRVLAAAVFSLNALLLYLLSRRFTGPGVSLLNSLLFMGACLYAYRIPNYSPLSVAFILSGSILFHDYLSGGKTRALVSSAFLVSAAFLFKQNYGVFVFSALFSVLFLKTFRSGLRPSALFLLSFLAPIISVFAYFYRRGAIGELFDYTFLALFGGVVDAYYMAYPLIDLQAPLSFTGDLYNYTPFRNLTIWSLKEGYIGKAWVCAGVSALYLLPLLVLFFFSLYLGARFLKRRAVDWKEAALFLSSLGLFWGVFPRSDFHHFAHVTPLLIVAGGLLFEKVYARARPLGMLYGALALLFLLAGAVSAYLPLLLERPEESGTLLETPRAGGIRVRERKARTVKAMVDYIRENTAPGEPILVVPTDSMYYFLAERKNPTRFPLIIPGAMEEAEVIKALEEREVRHIIYSDMSFDNTPLKRQFPALHDYIAGNYRMDEGYSVAENPDAVYVLKRGKAGSEDFEVIPGGSPVLAEGLSVRYDFVENLLHARNEIILQGGERRPPYNPRQVAPGAWLMKDVLLQQPPRNWAKVSSSYGIKIPSESWLRFSISLSPVVWYPEDGDGVLFEVYAYDLEGKNLERLFSRYIDPKNNPSERRWFNYLLSLRKYGGRNAVISFVTSGGPRLNLSGGKVDTWKHTDEAGWGNPAVLSRKTSGAEAPGAALPDEAVKEMALLDPRIFENEARLYPHDFDVRFTLGRVYDSLGEREKAARELAEAVSISPSNSWARSLLARQYTELKEFEKAEAALKEGLREDHGDIQLLLSMGGLMRARERFEEAAKWYEMGVEADPGNQWAHLALGNSYLSLKKYDLAAGSAKRALRINGRNSSAYLLLGDALRSTGRDEEAEKTYRKAVELAPGNPHAHGKLASLLKKRGRTGEALSEFRLAHSLDPGNTRFMEEAASLEKTGRK